jgi:hypothetical protein
MNKHRVGDIPHNDEMIVINHPVDPESAHNTLVAQRPTGELTRPEDNNVDDPSSKWYFNQINNFNETNDLRSVTGAINYIINQFVNINVLKAIKIKFAFSVLIEKHSHYESNGFKKVEDDYVQYSLSLGTEHFAKSAPFTLIFKKREEQQEILNDYLNASIRNMIEYVLDTSSTKYIGITGVAFYVFPLFGTGTRLIGCEELIKNQWIYSCNGDEGLCVIECIYIALHEEDYKDLKGARHRIFSKLKKQYEELFDKKYSYDIKNLNLNSTLELACKKYGLTFNIYSWSKEENKYEFEYDIAGGDTKVNLLLLSTTDLNNNQIQQIMYIKDLNSLTKMHICPKCQYMPPAML